MQENSLVVDQAGLFQFSGVLDQLRDSARFLVKNTDHTDLIVAKEMVDQLEILREQLKGVILPASAEMLDVLVPVIDRTAASYAQVYVAAAAMARWIDTLHQTPQFLLSQEVAVANAMKVSEKVEEVLSSGQQPVLALAGEPQRDLGCYL